MQYSLIGTVNCAFECETDNYQSERDVSNRLLQRRTFYGAFDDNELAWRIPLSKQMTIVSAREDSEPAALRSAIGAE
jgi:hypothetical protein